ncbi:MAG: dienelactone hydrolase family protein [Pirellulales bacterium]|nr:dienelactone hydrolase family protein [Pirellulales bacterium]
MVNYLAWGLLALVVGADPTEEAVARFEEREIKFTGGEYTDEVFRYRVLKPERIEPGKKYPVVLFLHGAGERGSDNRKQLAYLPEWMSDEEHREKYPCFLVAPQCRTNRWWINPNQFLSTKGEIVPLSTQLEAALTAFKQVLADEPIDRERIYLTGISMGGFGSWAVAGEYPRSFAAVAPICGGGRTQQAEKLVGVPLWAFHGDADPVVPVARTRMLIEALRAAGGDPKYTEFPGVAHDSWTPAYTDPTGLIPWMFEQKSDKLEPLP